MKNSLFIKNAFLNDRHVDILILDGIFSAIEPYLSVPPEVPILDACGKIIAPAFYNGHTHMAMSLMRGGADDMELFAWLKTYVWPLEAKLTPEKVRAGTRLAIREMLRSGTVFFNDSYWMAEETLSVAEEMGVRAAIGRFFIEDSSGMLNPACSASAAALEARFERCGAKDRLRLTYAPHSVYTISETNLKRLAAEAREKGEMLHIHASETRREVDDCLAKHGVTPIEWLHKCGGLTEKTALAHCVHVSDDDIALIRDSGALVIHNPSSNYKLCSGMFRFRDIYEKSECRLCLGTDGNASNNSLSMFGEMKLAALNAKMESGDPTCGKACDILHIATRQSALAFGINGGLIETGCVGDAILLDNSSPFMTPTCNLVSNIVYAADSSCVDTVICNGKVVFSYSQ